MLKRFLVVLLFVLSLFLVSPVLAADQRCWTKSKCEEAQGSFYGSSEKETNSETVKACGGTQNVAKEYLGFCKPPYVAQTEITFGNQNTFANIGEFIKFMFKYAVVAAAVVAIIMVIIAGAQWIGSGGNQEKISSAKKRIGGAMMGLFLAIMGYTVLNFINPYLVNLRLPQVWMINTQNLAPVYCSDLPVSSTVALAFDTGAKKTDAEKTQMLNAATFNVNSQEAVCGSDYFAKDAGIQTCSGVYCGLSSGQVCIPPLPSDATSGGETHTKPYCVKGQLMVHFVMSSVLETIKQTWPCLADVEGQNWLDTGNLVVWGVCKNINGNDLVIGNKWEKWDGGSEQKDVFYRAVGGFNEYWVLIGGLTGDKRAHEPSHWSCPSNYEVVGFVMKTEVGVKCNWRDANLFFGTTPTGGTIAGKWSDVGIQHYIPWEKLDSTGVFLNVDVSVNVLESILANKGQEPKKLSGGETDIYSTR